MGNYTTYLRETRSENDHFIVLSHLLDKILGSGSTQNKDLLHTTLNVNRNDVVRLWDGFKLAVHEGFVEIQHKRFASPDVLWLRA